MKAMPWFVLIFILASCPISLWASEETMSYTFIRSHLENVLSPHHIWDMRPPRDTVIQKMHQDVTAFLHSQGSLEPAVFAMQKRQLAVRLAVLTKIAGVDKSKKKILAIANLFHGFKPLSRWQQLVGIVGTKKNRRDDISWIDLRHSLAQEKIDHFLADDPEADVLAHPKKYLDELTAEALLAVIYLSLSDLDFSPELRETSEQLKQGILNCWNRYVVYTKVTCQKLIAAKKLEEFSQEKLIDMEVLCAICHGTPDEDAEESNMWVKHSCTQGYFHKNCLDTSFIRPADNAIETGDQGHYCCPMCREEYLKEREF